MGLIEQSQWDEALGDERINAVAQMMSGMRSKVAEPKISAKGKLVRMVGMALEATGCRAPIGSHCFIEGDHGTTEAEVVGFGDDKLYLMTVSEAGGLTPGATVVTSKRPQLIDVGEELLGRVIDGAGVPLDGLGELAVSHQVPMVRDSLNPFERVPISEPLDVGVRAINGLFTLGKGQRIGLFAGSGVGKSTLLGMMTKNTKAEIVVVALVGERGREVREFVEFTLGPEGMMRAVVVATPADASPLMRVHGALRATAIAEYFRDCGADVLLLFDSLTRFAQAQREISLSIGEFPVSKGYPPSVFAALPKLVERAGNNSVGSITAVYTVLVEGDDLNDPISDASRAILDGHIVLSRSIAEAGIYPSIDIESSISRSMNHLTSRLHQKQVLLLKKYYSLYQKNHDLLAMGAYREGADVQLDMALQTYPLIEAYIQQETHEVVTTEMAQTALAGLSSAWPEIVSMRAENTSQ